MTRPSTTISLLLFLAVWAATKVSATDSLRPMLGFEDNAEEQMPQKAAIKTDTYSKNTPTVSYLRRLQPASIILNALVNLLSPFLADMLEEEADRNSRFVINYKTTEDQGEVPLNFNQSWCNETTAFSAIEYALGEMKGIASLDVTTLELAQGSEDIDIKIGWPTSATWSGVWILETEFDVFDAATTATANNRFCNFTFPQVLTGNTLLTSPNVAMRLLMKGKTDNIASFRGTSQINQITIQQAEFGYTAIKPQLGWFQGMVSQDADEPLVQLGQSEFMREDLKNDVVGMMQEGLNSQMPLVLGS